MTLLQNKLKSYIDDVGTGHRGAALTMEKAAVAQQRKEAAMEEERLAIVLCLHTLYIHCMHAATVHMCCDICIYVCMYVRRLKTGQRYGRALTEVCTNVLYA